MAGRVIAMTPLAEAVMEVTLRADAPGETLVLLRGPGGLVYLQEEDFARLRLKLPPTPPVERGGHRYYAPADLRGCRVEIDELQQRVLVSPPPSALATTHLSSPGSQHPEVTPAAPGGFLNYQVSAQHIAGQTTGAVFGEVGAFAGMGVLTSTFVARSAEGTRQAVRLDTTYTRNRPDSLDTLSVGDAISDPGTWGDAVRYAGIRWSRNFALRPDLLTMPLLSTAGTATVPSTVDVFINNQLVTSSQLPAGPFIIDKLPIVSGTGDVSVVVRDALGREQVTTQTFYSSASLLAKGLAQYSVNLGSVRRNYALASDDYGRLVGEGSYRRGLTDSLTLEGHGEFLTGEAHAAGLNAVLGVGHLGLLNVTAARGGDAAGSGWLTGVGFEHRGRVASLVAGSQWATRDFAQVGQSPNPNFRLRQRSLLQMGTSLGRFGSLSLAFVHQTYQVSPAQNTISVTEGVSLGRVGTLNFTLSRTHNPELTVSGAAGGLATGPVNVIPAQNSTSAYLIFVHQLGNRSALTTTAEHGSGTGATANEFRETYTQSPPVGPGSGYRLSASTAGNYDADWRLQSRVADFDLESARNQGIEGQSALVTGALTWLDGRLDATRSINGSFAMVDVAGLADVPVYVENQLTAHTDSSGRVLLYNLRPYEANHISIEPTELPLDTTIAATTAIMAPPYRSGVIARFPVERAHGATLRLVTDEGRPVPVGATVTLLGADFPVVLDGRVYVTGYDHGMTAQAAWKGGQCRFRLPPPPADDPLPDLGTLKCQAGSPGAGSTP